MPIFRQPLQRISRNRHPCAMSQLPCSMLRALLLLACTAKVAAFAQTPPGCVDVDWGVLQSAYTGDPAESLAMVFEDSEDGEREEVPIASCADVAAGGGCDDESLAGFCCASCALPQRMTYRRVSRGRVTVRGSGRSVQLRDWGKGRSLETPAAAPLDRA